MKKLFYTFLLGAGIVSYQPAFSTTACGSDTVRYAHAKATGFMYDVNFNSSGTQIQSVGQWYPAPQPLSISAVEFHAFNTSTSKNITLQVDIYAAGADSLPTGNALATSFVQNLSKPLVIEYTSTKLVAIFNNPVITSKPYVVVVTTLGTPNVNAGIVSNNYKIAKPDGKGERLSEIYYNNAWVKAADIQVQPGGAGTKVYNLDCDFMIFPVVKYTLNAKFGYSPKTTCYDTSTIVSFKDSSSAILTSKFYNQNEFLNTAQKSYTWSFEGNIEQTTTDPSYQFTMYGLESVVLTDSVVGWTSVCISTKQVDFAVNVLSTSPNVAICEGQSTLLQAIGANSFKWSPTTGLSATNEAFVKASPTITTTYTVSGTVGTCTKMQSILVTVHTLPKVSISSTPSSGHDGTATVFPTTGDLYKWNTGATSSEITGLAPGKYTVTVTDTNQCTAYDSVTVAQVITGLSQTNYDGSYSIYPNPSNSQLFVSFAQGGSDAPGNISLFNAQGIAVMNVAYNGAGLQPIQLANLPSGVYTLVYNSGTRTISKKISKVD